MAQRLPENIPSAPIVAWKLYGSASPPISAGTSCSEIMPANRAWGNLHRSYVWLVALLVHRYGSSSSEKYIDGVAGRALPSETAADGCETTVSL